MLKIIDYLRYALYGVLAFTIAMLFQAWDKEHAKPLASSINSLPTSSNSSANYVPNLPSAEEKATHTAIHATIGNNQPKNQLIHVVTDVLDVTIDTLGGNITTVKLLNYPAESGSKEPVVLFNGDPHSKYIAQSGLLGINGPDTSNGQALYQADKFEYNLNNTDDAIQVNLYWQNQAGLKVTKTFTFKRDNYEIDVDYQIHNQSANSWEGNLYLQLMRKNTPPTNAGLMNLATFFGAAISSPDKRFQKISFKDMQQQDLDKSINGGWAAMIQHYFVSAWVPPQNATSQYFSRVTDDGLYTIGLIGPKLVVSAHTELATQAKLYAGPAIAKCLEQVAPGLKLTIDYGMFWFIAAAIFWMMQLIHEVVGNWGWSIVLVTLVIKVLFYPLSAKSYRSMSMLKKLQPRLNALKERYAEDKQKFTQATIELYRAEKVNPMSGCLPILIQIPVFIGLYWVLVESVELRQAPFILWIQDLTQKDPFLVLPVLMVISMLLQQRLNPPPPDPMQAKVMMLMPFVFGALFYNFPAGLMLYWFVNNTLSFLQQWYVMRSVNHAEKRKK